MTPQERIAVAEAWTVIAATFGRDLTRATMKAMLDAIDDLPFEAVMRSLNGWMRTSKTGRHPYPAEIREAIHPEVNSRLSATEIARKIDRACIKHGFYWSQGIMGPNGFYFEDDKGNKFPTFKEAVISELGLIGWHAIYTRGGWEQMAQSANSMDEGQFIAQLRDQCEASIQLQKQGYDFLALDMPGSKKESIDSNILKLLGDKKL